MLNIRQSGSILLERRVRVHILSMQCCPLDGHQRPMATVHSPQSINQSMHTVTEDLVSQST